MYFIIKTCEFCEPSALQCRSKVVLLAASSSAEPLSHFQATRATLYAQMWRHLRTCVCDSVGGGGAGVGVGGGGGYSHVAGL